MAVQEVKYAGTEDIVRTNVGWDGHSNPIIRQIAKCGCRYFQDGKLERRCSDHRGQAFVAVADGSYYEDSAK